MAVDARGRRIPDKELIETEDGTRSQATSRLTIDEETGNKFSGTMQTAIDSSRAAKKGFEPGEMEQKLLDAIGAEGLAELERLAGGTLFQLDDATRQQLDRIRSTRIESAERSVEFGLDRAAGAANAGAAGRGLPRGSLRAELQARLQGPVLERFQQQIAGIESADAEARIGIPRQDVGIRQSVLNSPALTALQRSRLSSAELRLRLRGIQAGEKAAADANKFDFGGALGQVAGAVVGAATGGPAGAAAGSEAGKKVFQ